MLTASLAHARDTLNFAADQIATGLVPAGRASATAATFRQLAESAVGGNPLTLGDLVAGLEVLAAPHGDDEPAHIAARRKTCAEIAELLRPVSAGDAQRLAAAWRAVEADFRGSTDPRHIAIATTAGREASEIESANAQQVIR